VLTLGSNSHSSAPDRGIALCVEPDLALPSHASRPSGRPRRHTDHSSLMSALSPGLQRRKLVHATSAPEALDDLKASAQAPASGSAEPQEQHAAEKKHWLLSTTDGIVPTCASVGFGCLFLALACGSAYQLIEDDSSLAPSVSHDGAKRMRPVVLVPSLPLKSRPAAAALCCSAPLAGHASHSVLMTSCSNLDAQVTLGWNALYYCFLQAQGASAFWVHQALREQGSKSLNTQEQPRAMVPLSFAKVKYGVEWSRSGLIFVMDRSVGNLLEQTPPFLLAVWLHALIASPTWAAQLGWAWLILRAFYPFAFARRPTPGARLGVSIISAVTWPSYAIVWALLLGAARACW
jgi:uncharacterized membrane protein YecN with MAPEG domain